MESILSRHTRSCDLCRVEVLCQMHILSNALIQSLWDFISPSTNIKISIWNHTTSHSFHCIVLVLFEIIYSLTFLWIIEFLQHYRLFSTVQKGFSIEMTQSIQFNTNASFYNATTIHTPCPLSWNPYRKSHCVSNMQAHWKYA